MPAKKILAENPARLWDEQYIKMFVKQVKDRVGDAGWRYLSLDMKEALVCQKALDVAIGMGRGDVSCQAIRILRFDMLTIAGLIDD